MFGQIFGALEGLEAAGICHNDIKKRNFLVFPDQTVKLIDFGISHFIDYNNETLAHPDFYRCTPGHRPPEYQIAWALAETWKCQGCNTKTDGKSCSESDCPHDKVNRSVGRSLGLYTRFPLPRDLRFPNNNSSDVWSAAVTFLFCLDTKGLSLFSFLLSFSLFIVDLWSIENGLEKDEHCEYHTLGSAFRWSLVQKLDPEWFISRLVERTGVQFPKVKSYIDLDQSFQSNPEQIKLLVPIIKACLHPDPFLRPTPKQIMQMFKKAIEE
jgi:serine/threonine protein kinase